MGRWVACSIGAWAFLPLTQLGESKEAGFAGLVTKQTGRLSRPVCCATQRGGTRGKPGFPCASPLGRQIAVDVLVDTPVVRAKIAAPEADGPLLRLDGVQGPALLHVGGRRILVLRR